jgi:hypothetical protein
LFWGTALLFCVVLMMRMGRGEFYVIGATCAIALLNWLFVQGRRNEQNANG